MGSDLLDRLLSLDPANRITAQQALDHEYFRTEPLECLPLKLPKIEIDTHEYQVRNRIRLEQLRLNIRSTQLRPADPASVVRKKRHLPVQFETTTKQSEPPAHVN